MSYVKDVRGGGRFKAALLASFSALVAGLFAVFLPTAPAQQNAYAPSSLDDRAPTGPPEQLRPVDPATNLLLANPVQLELPAGYPVSPLTPKLPDGWGLPAIPGHPSPHDWALTTNAALSLAWDGHCTFNLGWDTPTPENIERWKKYLASYWGITGHDQALGTAGSLSRGGSREAYKNAYQRLIALPTEQLMAQLDAAPEASRFRLLAMLHNAPALGDQAILAWDLCRAIQVAGRAEFVGYITEDEAWKTIMPVARDLQKGFGSWEEMGRSYMAGRENWTIEEIKRAGPKFRAIQKGMLEDPKSPYNTIPWKLDLGE